MAVQHVSRQRIGTAIIQYVKPINKVLARHRPNTCLQKVVWRPGQLEELNADSNFTNVATVKNRKAVIREAFVGGLQSIYILLTSLKDTINAL